MVLLLAFGFKADVKGAQELLRYSRHSPLYPRIKRDAAIGYCLEHRMSATEAQLMLSELELPAIGGRR